MSIGKLYKSNDEQFVVNVSYNIHAKWPTKLSGELKPEEYRKIDDGGGYILELEDKRKCECQLNKLVNRPVSGFPPRWVYNFNGRMSNT